MVCALPLCYASGLCVVCVSTDTNFLHGSLTFQRGCGGMPFDRDTHKHTQAPFPVILLACGLVSVRKQSLRSSLENKSRATYCTSSMTAAHVQVSFHGQTRGDMQNDTFTRDKFCSVSDVRPLLAGLPKTRRKENLNRILRWVSWTSFPPLPTYATLAPGVQLTSAGLCRLLCSSFYDWVSIVTTFFFGGGLNVVCCYPIPPQVTTHTSPS